MAHVLNTHAHSNYSIGHIAAATLGAPLVWLRRRRERRELDSVLGLPDYLIKDIGLQRSDIAREAVKPFWRP